MSILLLLINLFQWHPPVPVHNYHISQTKIEYAAEQEEWQISIHVFIDDLEAALKQSGNPRLHLGMKRESEDADTYIQAYMNKGFKLKDGDGQEMSCQWLGKEMTEDMASFWIYLYVDHVSEITSIQIENRLFTELFDDQQNIIDLYYSANQNWQFLFNKDYWKAKVDFE